MRHEAQTRYGNKKFYLQPRVKKYPSKWSLNNFKLQSDSRQNHLSGKSKDRPSVVCVAGLAHTTQRLFMLKEYNCFVTLWLFFSHRQSLCFYSHLSALLNANHSGLLRLICLLWISERQHHYYLSASSLLSELWSFKEQELFLFVSNGIIKMVCICLHCQSSANIICSSVSAFLT